MAGSGCRSPMSICAVRLSRLLSTGVPVSGHSAGAISLQGGIGLLKWTKQMIVGDDIAELDGCGGLAVARKYPNRLKRFDVELDLIDYSYEIRELAYGASLLLSGPNTIGAADLVDTACGAAAVKNGVYLEAWGENFECSQNDATYPYHRVIFPRVYFDPSDGTMQRGTNHLVLQGFSSVNDAAGNGPFNDIPTLPASTSRAVFEDTALPTASVDCGYVTTPSQS